MLSFPVFADREPRPSLPASFRFLRSSSSSLFFSGDCALFPATAVSQPFYYPFLAHSFHRHGGCTPSFAPFFPVLPNSFTCHTSEKSPSNSHHCHTSKTAVCNPCVCHTSETPPGLHFLNVQMRSLHPGWFPGTCQHSNAVPSYPLFSHSLAPSQREGYKRPRSVSWSATFATSSISTIPTIRWITPGPSLRRGISTRASRRSNSKALSQNPGRPWAAPI